MTMQLESLSSDAHRRVAEDSPHQFPQATSSPLRVGQIGTFLPYFSLGPSTIFCFPWTLDLRYLDSLMLDCPSVVTSSPTPCGPQPCILGLNYATDFWVSSLLSCAAPHPHIMIFVADLLAHITLCRLYLAENPGQCTWP